jgi:hypothetical protein
MDHGGKNIIQGKIFIKFKKDIWPKNMHQLILKSKICNEYWRPTSNIFHGNFIYNGLSNLIKISWGRTMQISIKPQQIRANFLNYPGPIKCFSRLRPLVPFFGLFLYELGIRTLY